MSHIPDYNINHLVFQGRDTQWLQQHLMAKSIPFVYFDITALQTGGDIYLTLSVIWFCPYILLQGCMWTSPLCTAKLCVFCVKILSIGTPARGKKRHSTFQKL